MQPESGPPPAATDRHAALLELVFTITLALAAVGTAWAGFQSAKWGGVQASAFAAASADRVEHSRLSTEAGQLQTLDVILFTDWLLALNEEILADEAATPERAYQPEPGTLSSFLHERFRDEFQPAFEAWITQRPLENLDAPATPFEMAEYELAAEAESARLLAQAEQHATDARAANQRSDNYVLLSVMFALVLFFVALGGKARARRSRYLLLAMSIVALLVASGLLTTYPVQL